MIFDKRRYRVYTWAKSQQSIVDPGDYAPLLVLTPSLSDANKYAQGVFREHGYKNVINNVVFGIPGTGAWCDSSKSEIDLFLMGIQKPHTWNYNSIYEMEWSPNDMTTPLYEIALQKINCKVMTRARISHWFGI